MGDGRKLTTLSHKQKRDICNHKQKNPLLTNREMLAWVLETMNEKVSEATMGRLLKKSMALLSNVTANEVKRERAPLNPQVEEALYRWFLSAQEGRVVISDDLLMEKARILHSLVRERHAHVKECVYSNGWLMGFKKRHNIRLIAFQGEEESCDLTEESWDKFNVLKANLSGYEPQDIFNLDETSLFYKLQPNKSLADKVMKGVKKEKERLSVGLCSNMDGSIKLPPLVISKWKMPRAFSRRRIKQISNVGVSWYHNTRAWMTGAVFQDWVTKFDKHFESLGRKKVALLVDNAPGHVWKPIEKKLKVTKVFCLPANTTARFQPMDAGVVRCFKAHYRRLLIRKQLADFEKKTPFYMDVYHACTFTVQAWNDGVTRATIKNCWRHCNLETYRDQRPNRTMHDFDLNETLKDPDMDAQIEELGEYLSLLSFRSSVDMTVEEYLEVDSVQNAPTFEIHADMGSYLGDFPDYDNGEEEEVVNGEEDDDPEEPISVVNMTYGMGMTYFENLKMFLQQQHYDTTAMSVELEKMAKACTKEHLNDSTSSTVATAFERERLQ